MLACEKKARRVGPPGLALALPTKSRLRIVPRPETFPGEEAKPAGATRQARTLRLLLLVPVAHDAPCDEGEHGGPCEGCYDRGQVSAGAFV